MDLIALMDLIPMAEDSSNEIAGVVGLARTSRVEGRGFQMNRRNLQFNTVNARRKGKRSRAFDWFTD